MTFQKKTIDIIMPSSQSTRQYTRSSIRQLRSNTKHDVNIIVVNDTDVEDWGYNKALNIGAKQGNGEYVFFVNNDLIYTKHWDVNLIKSLDNHHSCSPFCARSMNVSPLAKIIEGHKTGTHLAGWAIMMKRKTWLSIGGFDEDFSFWCCDNSFEEQIKLHKLKHCLVVNSRVDHIGSKTLDKNKHTVMYKELTSNQIKKFNKKFNKNLFNLGK